MIDAERCAVREQGRRQVDRAAERYGGGKDVGHFVDKLARHKSPHGKAGDIDAIRIYVIPINDVPQQCFECGYLRMSPISF